MISEIEKFANGYRLAGVKEFMGIEGNGWEGVLVRDGKSLGEVGNAGDGGMTWTRIGGAERELAAHAESIYGKRQYVSATETFLESLVSYELMAKKAKSLSKTCVLFVTQGLEKDENGVERSFYSVRTQDSEAARKAILRQHKDAKFLNDEFSSWVQVRKPGKSASKRRL